MYDPRNPYPPSTVCTPLLERDPIWPEGHQDRTWVSEPTAQLAPMSGALMSGGLKGKEVVDRTRDTPILDIETMYRMPEQTAGGGYRIKSQMAEFSTISEPITETQAEVDPEQQAVEREQQLVAQMTALRLPVLPRRKQPVVPPSTSSLHANDDYVPFDPVDPYHHSGQPKKKTLYGPEGYLGKKKDWKQTPLQKMVSKVNSVSTRVVSILSRKNKQKQTNRQDKTRQR